MRCSGHGWDFLCNLPGAAALLSAVGRSVTDHALLRRGAAETKPLVTGRSPSTIDIES